MIYLWFFKSLLKLWRLYRLWLFFNLHLNIFFSNKLFLKFRFFGIYSLLLSFWGSNLSLKFFNLCLQIVHLFVLRVEFLFLINVCFLHNFIIFFFDERNFWNFNFNDLNFWLIKKHSFIFWGFLFDNFNLFPLFQVFICFCLSFLFKLFLDFLSIRVFIFICIILII